MKDNNKSKEWPRLNIAVNPRHKSAWVKVAQRQGMSITDFTVGQLNNHPEVKAILEKDDKQLIKCIDWFIDIGTMGTKVKR